MPQRCQLTSVVLSQPHAGSGYSLSYGLFSSNSWMRRNAKSSRNNHDAKGDVLWRSHASTAHITHCVILNIIVHSMSLHWARTHHGLHQSFGVAVWRASESVYSRREKCDENDQASHSSAFQWDSTPASVESHVESQDHSYCNCATDAFSPSTPPNKPIHAVHRAQVSAHTDSFEVPSLLILCGIKVAFCFFLDTQQNTQFV